MTCLKVYERWFPFERLVLIFSWLLIKIWRQKKEFRVLHFLPFAFQILVSFLFWIFEESRTLTSEYVILYVFCIGKWVFYHVPPNGYNVRWESTRKQWGMSIHLSNPWDISTGCLTNKQNFWAETKRPLVKQNPNRGFQRGSLCLCGDEGKAHWVGKARSHPDKDPASPEDPWYLLPAGGRALKERKHAIRFVKLCHLSRQWR